MFPVRLTLVAPLLGLREVTVGAVVSGGAAVVKVHEVFASGLFAMSRTAVVPPVSLTVYRVFAARFADGFRVATRVAAS
jgi:hypothetical protein